MCNDWIDAISVFNVQACIYDIINRVTGGKTARRRDRQVTFNSPVDEIIQGCMNTLSADETMS